jgi:hypothetical protein
MTDDEHKGARGYSWPPFEAGHTLSIVHGADSPRTVAARAELVRPRLFEVCPWLHETMDVIAVDRFLRAEARALILHEHIAAVTDEKGAGKVPVRLWEQVTAADRLAAQLGNVLGLDPTGRARLQQTVASTEATLADLAAQGAQTRGRRPGAGQDVGGDDGAA